VTRRREVRMAVRIGLVLPVLSLMAVTAVTRQAHAQRMSTTPEQAYDQGEVPNARALAMGGALNALGVSTAALFLNPANMSLARVYHLEALAAYSPEAKRQTYGIAAVDSVLNASGLAGGLGATWNEFDPSGMHRVWTDIRSAAGLPLGQYLSFGTTARWLHSNQDTGVGPFGPSLASDGKHPLEDLVTFDAGLTLNILDGLRIAVVGHNLTDPKTAVAPTTAELGIGFFTPTFAIEADGSLDFTTWNNTRGRLMGGIEYFAADHYALRAGWRYDGGTNINSPSLGLGYIGPSWSIEISGRRDLIAQHAETFGVLSLRYFYDATGSSTQSQTETMQ
jgi:hypothetical protein